MYRRRDGGPDKFHTTTMPSRKAFACSRRFLNGSFYRRRAPSAVCWQRKHERKKSKGKEKKTLPSAMKILKVLSKSTSNCVLKLLDPPFTGALFLIEHINSLGIFIYYNNFMLLALFPDDESVLITRCSNRWLKFHSNFSNPFSALLPARASPSTTAERHYKYLLRAMKTWQWESWKLKLVRERQIYDYCPSAFGERAAGRKANRHDTELRPTLHTERTSPPELRLCFVFIILMAGILNKPNFMTIWLCIVSCSNDSIGWCARWNSWWLCFLALYACLVSIHAMLSLRLHISHCLD